MSLQVFVGCVPARESRLGDPALASRYPLALIAAKPAVHFLNSGYANLPRQLKAEREPRLDMHPDDATVRKVEDGAWVRDYNARGEVSLRARVGDRARVGVVGYTEPGGNRRQHFDQGWAERSRRRRRFS